MKVLKDEWTHRIFGRHQLVEVYCPVKNKNSYLICKVGFRRATTRYSFDSYEEANTVFERMR